MHKPRTALALLATLALMACGGTPDLSKPPTPFGDFRLGYAIVVAKDAQPVGPSRKATPEEWKTALEGAIKAQLGRYEGDKLYHVGVGVHNYALAVPGIPIVLSPKSVLQISVDVWDDTAQRTINAETKQFTIWEGLNPGTMIGSGLTKSREEQMATLSANAAKAINDWLVQNKAWFTPEAVAARKLLPPMTGTEAATPAATSATTPAKPAAKPAAKAKPAAAAPVVPAALP